ncbi:hypothetical protein TNCV_1506651 [Trichonephila clavipes]|nr:hypothetical protein TNCV_1506651 [Trichonephila clavipes]
MGISLKLTPFSKLPQQHEDFEPQFNGPRYTEVFLVSSRLDCKSFAMQEKGSNRFVPGSDYMVDALKLPNQAPRGYGELLQKYVFWRCPDGTQHLFCWPILVNR